MSYNTYRFKYILITLLYLKPFMKKTIFSLLALSVSFTGLKAASPAPKPNVDILVVNVGEVYNSYYRAQEGQEKLQAVIDAAQKELNAMLESGTALAKEVEDMQVKLNNPSLSEDAKKDLQNQLKTKIADLQAKEAEVNQFRQDKQGQFNERRQSMLNLYLGEIGDAATKIAKARGAKYILNANAVLYTAPEANATEEVITALNAEKPKTETPAKSSK